MLSPRHFQTSTGMLSGPTAFTLFIIAIVALTSSLLIRSNSRFTLPIIQPSLSHFLPSSVPQSIPSIFSLRSPRLSVHFHHCPSPFWPVVRPFQLGVSVSPISTLSVLLPWCPIPHTARRILSSLVSLSRQSVHYLFSFLGVQSLIQLVVSFPAWCLCLANQYTICSPSSVSNPSYSSSYASSPPLSSPLDASPVLLFTFFIALHLPPLSSSVYFPAHRHPTTKSPCLPPSVLLTYQVPFLLCLSILLP